MFEFSVSRTVGKYFCVFCVERAGGTQEELLPLYILTRAPGTDVENMVRCSLAAFQRTLPDYIEASALRVFCVGIRRENEILWYASFYYC